ncbi:MAG: hypothetical protein ACREIF_10995 [Chthoniobacterales bacterium]
MTVDIAPYSRKAEVHPNRGSDSMVAATAGTSVVVYSGRKKSGEGLIAGRTSSDEGREDYYSFRVGPVRQSHGGMPRNAEKVVRRIQGFVVEDEGEEYKVGLVDGDEATYYYMPASAFRKAGISAPNQPFQMDEIEVEISGGRKLTGYAFTPLAGASDVFNDAIDLTDERSRKLNIIFKKYGEASP